MRAPLAKNRQCVETFLPVDSRVEAGTLFLGLLNALSLQSKQLKIEDVVRGRPGVFRVLRNA